MKVASVSGCKKEDATGKSYDPLLKPSRPTPYQLLHLPSSRFRRLSTSVPGFSVSIAPSELGTPSPQPTRRASCAFHRAAFHHRPLFTRLSGQLLLLREARGHEGDRRTRFHKSPRKAAGSLTVTRL